MERPVPQLRPRLLARQHPRGVRARPAAGRARRTSSTTTTGPSARASTTSPRTTASPCATSSPTTSSTTAATASPTGTAPTTTGPGTAASRARPTTPASTRCGAGRPRTSWPRSRWPPGCRWSSPATSSGARRAATTTPTARTPPPRGCTGTPGTSGPGLTDLTRRLLALRAEHPVFRRTTFRHGEQLVDTTNHPTGRKNLAWFGGGARTEMGPEDWQDPHRRTLGVYLAHDAPNRDHDEAFLVWFHGGADEVHVELPDGGWADTYTRGRAHRRRGRAAEREDPGRQHPADPRPDGRGPAGRLNGRTHVNRRTRVLTAAGRRLPRPDPPPASYLRRARGELPRPLSRLLLGPVSRGDRAGRRGSCPPSRTRSPSASTARATAARTAAAPGQPARRRLRLRQPHRRRLAVRPARGPGGGRRGLGRLPARPGAPGARAVRGRVGRDVLAAGARRLARRRPAAGPCWSARAPGETSRRWSPWRCATGAGPTRVPPTSSAQVLIYPSTDLTMSSASALAMVDAPVLNRAAVDWYGRQYVPQGLPHSIPPEDPRVSPLRALGPLRAAPGPGRRGRPRPPAGRRPRLRRGPRAGRASPSGRCSTPTRCTASCRSRASSPRRPPPSTRRSPIRPTHHNPPLGVNFSRPRNHVGVTATETFVGTESVIGTHRSEGADDRRRPPTEEHRDGHRWRRPHPHPRCCTTGRPRCRFPRGPVSAALLVRPRARRRPHDRPAAPRLGRCSPATPAPTRTCSSRSGWPTSCTTAGWPGWTNAGSGTPSCSGRGPGGRSTSLAGHRAGGAAGRAGRPRGTPPSERVVDGLDRAGRGGRGALAVEVPDAP